MNFFWISSNLLIHISSFLLPEKKNAVRFAHLGIFTFIISKTGISGASRAKKDPIYAGCISLVERNLLEVRFEILLLSQASFLLLIHSAGSDHVFTHVVRPFSKSCKTKQISSENYVHYWRDCGSGRVDHCLVFSWLNRCFQKDQDKA